MPDSHPRRPVSGPGPAPDAAAQGHPAPLSVDDAPTVISGKSIREEAQARQEPFSQLLRGRRLAQFEIEETIGVGGMAAVLKARDTQLDRTVALKILPPEMARDPENIRRFEQEARAAARLDHDNIARVFHYGQDQGLHFIAFELVDGTDLKTLLEQRGRMELAEAVECMLQIAGGLAHAASRGVVHRDIKPSNILIDPGGRARLVDMGLARSLETRPDEAVTQSGVTLGTFDYISPEQALDPRSADVRSDLYSLGCTFYHLITGRPPTPQGTAARKLHFHQHEPPVDPRHWNPEIPDAAAAILSRMMAKDPADRYQSPDQLVEHLQWLRQQLRQEANGDSRTPPSLLYPDPPPWRPLPVLIGSAAAVMLLVILASSFLGPNREPAAGAQRPARPGGDSTVGAGKNQEQPPAPSAAADVHTHLEFLDALAATSTRVINLHAPLFDLGRLDEADAARLRLRQRHLLIRAPLSQRPVLRLGSGLEDAIPLTLDGGRLVLEGIRLEFTPSARSACALLILSGSLVLKDCELAETGPPAGVPASSASAIRAVRPAGGGAPSLSIDCEDCVFLGGGVAVRLEEGGRCEFRRCLFGPYETLVAAGGQAGSLAPSAIAMTDCLAQGVEDAVIEIDAQRPYEVNLRGSVFTARDAAKSSSVFQVGPGQLGYCTLKLDEDYFQSFDSLVSSLTPDRVEEVAVGADELARHPGVLQERDSRLGRDSPWADSQPLRALADGDLLSAFQLNTSLAALRRANGAMLGPSAFRGRQRYPNLAAAPVLPPGPSGTKELVVDGKGGREGHYKTLAAAVADAAAHDDTVIVLRASGPLATPPLDIVGSRNVTIRAAPGFTPELELHRETAPGADGEASLFRVHDGELTLEQLQFRLQSSPREAARLQSVVLLTGVGQCRWRGCVATLPAAAESRMAVICLADPTGAMMGMGGKPPRPGLPGIDLEDCLVRGDGDGVYVKASRPFRLEVKNTLAALSGSLLAIDGNRPDAVSASETLITLDHVTAYLGQSLLVMQASAANPLQVPVRVSAAATCMFASAEGSPLIRVEGPQSEQELKRKLSWQGKRNCYQAQETLLLWQPQDRLEMAHRYNGDRWEELWGRDDEQPRFIRSVRYAGVPGGERALPDILPGDFRILAVDPPEAEAASLGANLERLPLPLVPAAVGRTTPE